ncbi:hypothetical protein F945_02271 [Acinetobacter rudis CIP 110305]|uniref:Phosphoglycerate mutase n=1 Tax=Acinetobacter rudis CIP 110305 TaxID=421052 RepID=S3MVX1_9GAMM|nr:hypothetical protein F945_02271 [Acinetobacter rudis CIP 110305]
MLKLLPQSMLDGIDLLPDLATPVTLFTRHSLREMVSGQGLAGYDLQLTEQGRDLAQSWGAHLVECSQRELQYCISSPIQRCRDTASLMIQGAQIAGQAQSMAIDIVSQGLLVEPGSFVVDIQQAAPYFRREGALGFINSFINHRLPGMKHPIDGVLDVLELIFNTHPEQQAGLSLAVSHDTIIAALVAVISRQQQIAPEDWPEMMEGLFVWFEGDRFLSSCIHWIWRGKQHHCCIEDLQQQIL